MLSLVLASTIIVQAAEHGKEAEPMAFGLGPAQFVALAMVAVILLLIWKKVPGAIGKALDSKIETIKSQLAEAEDLRKEAEALKAEYEAKAKSADKERKAMLARAQKEADEIVAKAGRDAEALIERRGRMAEEKIAAEERSAIDQLKSAAAEAATKAAALLIAERNDAASDSRLIDRAIGDLGKR